MLHIVLINPEIPPNTGNIARSCAATNTRLHLVKPLGFSIDDASVRRAGLDYWPYVDLEVHESIEDFLAKYGDCPLYLSTTKGKRLFTEVEYEDGAMLLFGRETKGLPPELIAAYEDRTIRIPMSENTKLRSFNLSNSANIVLFEALRQQGFPELS